MIFTKGEHGVLKPADSYTYEKMKYIMNGSEVGVEIIAERNDKLFRLYWCVMRLCYDHLHDRIEGVNSVKQFSDLLQAFVAKKGHSVAGRFVKYGGIVAFERASLAYKNMSQAKFEKYYELAIDEVLLWMGKAGLDMTKEDLVSNAKNYYNE